MGDLKMPMHVRLEAVSSLLCFCTKAVQLVGRFADLRQRLFQRELLILVCAQYGVDHTLQEASSRAIGMEDADRRDGHRQAGVVVDELGESLLRPLVLGEIPRIEVIVLLLVIRSVFQLLEDLGRQLAGFGGKVGLSVRWWGPMA
jgi:hypothetical protein